MVWSNIPVHGIFDHAKVEYTVIWFIQPWYGRIYRYMVYSTMVRSNVPVYGIFNHGKVEYTGTWYTRPW